MQPALTIALILLGGAAPAAPPDDLVQVVDGTRRNVSHVARGPIDRDLTDPIYHTPYRCDVAVITAKPRGGSVMIQFARKRGGAADVIGFAGTPAGKGRIDVQRIYIAGTVSAVAQANCVVSYAGANVSSIACGGQVDRDGTRTRPMIAFDAN